MATECEMMSPRAVDGDYLMSRLYEIHGVVSLAYHAVFVEAGTSPELNSAWNALGLAMKELERVTDELDSKVVVS